MKMKAMKATSNMQIAVDPKLDGIEFINISTKGKTPLGRKLSHFVNIPLEHPKYGKFSSMEGFWYYIQLGSVSDTSKEELRRLHGYAAKSLGRQLLEKYKYSMFKMEGFRKEIYVANKLKIIQNKEILDLVLSNKLPYKLFYLDEYGNTRTTYSVSWLIKDFTHIQRELKEEYKT